MTKPVSDEPLDQPTEELERIVYVKERPLKKLAIGTVAVLGGLIVLLFVLGMILGALGKSAPTVDKQIIEDQWNKTVKNTATSYHDCVGKEGAMNSGVFPPSCSLAGETFVQPLADACKSLEEVDSLEPDHACAPAGSDANEAGKKAGKVAKKSWDATKEFADGFMEEVK